MNIPIYILSDNNRWMIWTFGEVQIVETLVGTRRKHIIHLENPIETEGDRTYRIEIPSAKVIFRGWLSKDRMTIHED